MTLSNRPKHKTDTYIDIKETAATLSVSPATIRNWMKAGKLTPVWKQDRKLYFNKNDIHTIKSEITSGQSHRLKSRRNKKAVSGFFIPTEYVASRTYVTMAEKLLDLVSETKPAIDPPLILHEVILNLLMHQGRLRLSFSYPEKCLTELVQENHLHLGSYQQIIEDIYRPDTPIKNAHRKLLLEIRNLSIPYIQGDDVLGLLYMSLTNLCDRKNKGTYYTPSDIVDQLVSDSLRQLINVDLPKVVDPCCGSGNFLIKLFFTLKKRLIAKGMTVIDAEKTLLTTCICGFDIDPMAAKLAEVNLILLLETPYDQLYQCPLHIHAQNTFIDSSEEAFDLVIGNPPWGYSFSIEETSILKKRFVTGKRTVESFCLFIEFGIERLKPNGILSYVLPESLLNVQMHEPTRQFLISRTHLCLIDILGHRFTKVFAPTILLIAKKAQPHKKNQVLARFKEKEHLIEQDRFIKNEGTVFNVKTSNKEDTIIKHMRTLGGVHFLRGQADFALGIVTGNNKEYILKERKIGAELVLKGGDIFKYHYHAGEQYIVFDPSLFQQVAPEKWYRAPEKLIYRFINEQLIFAYDNQGILSLNSANVVIPKLEGVAVKYILAVLNSRPAQFFHQLTFSSIKVLRRHIESIPVPPCTKAEQEKVIQLVDQLLQSNKASERSAIYEQIDHIIMSLYQLNKDQKALILEKVHKKK